MEVQSMQQADAVVRLKQMERVQRLLDTARGPSWIRGRVLLFVQLAFVTALMTVMGDDAKLAAIGLLVVAVVTSAIEESLGKRIRAVLELLELHGIPRHAGADARPASPAPSADGV